MKGGAVQPSEKASAIRALSPSQVKINLPNLIEQPWDYQKQDIAWCLLQKNGIIGSEVGTGKTMIAIGMASYLKDRDGWRGMVVLMPKQGGILPIQWMGELEKFAPNLKVASVARRKSLDKSDRANVYAGDWDVLLINYEAARNDAELLSRMFDARKPSILYCDEASMFRNGASKTARMVKRISKHFDYKFAVTGTPMQTNLEDLHGICSSMGWTELVGTKAQFQRDYLIQQQVEFFARGAVRKKLVTIGYKNIPRLRETLAPWFIRRTLTDPEVAKRIPAVVPFVFRLPMRVEQQRLYDVTLDGIVAEIENGEVITGYVDALQKFSRLSAIADGTQTYNAEMRDHSAKSDWLMEKLRGSMAGEKVLVFSRFVRSVRPLQRRLEAEGIGYGLFLGGDHQTVDERMEDVRRFREDEDCRVLLATQAVEMGLNLQVARVLVFYSMLPNPARMEQVLGRIRRAGSKYANVAAITLLSEGTVEEGLYDVTLERNAVKDVLWQEESVLFETLGADRMMQLIRGWRPNDDVG